MDLSNLLNLILGPGGALICLSLACFFLYRENKACKTRLDAMIDARLEDAEETEMVLKTLLPLLQEKEKRE